MIILGNRNPADLKPLIEAAFSAKRLKDEDHHNIEEAMGYINRGHLRAAHYENGKWHTQAWVKQTILLYFKICLLNEIRIEPYTWLDKIPIKRWSLDMGVRVVPPAVVRFGAFVGKGCVLMPSYVNIGAFVDEGTMVDTWATVGSCAQIGKNVHLSGGVGIGGVLEPLQARPVIIEDDCFIGSRAVIVEGVLVKKRAVIGAGVVLTASTAIVDVRGKEPIITKGLVPENSVVIPGTIPKDFPAGSFNVPCALIIGERKPSTDLKTSLNQALREFDVPV
jgi:2,3,4,5-tetrahydropyridine-2-carboxylate N-succinyltransferase